MWHLMQTAPLPAAWNMGIDAALLERARATGDTVLRVYSWSRPALSLGRHQRAVGLYDAARATGQGVDVVRRPTGGRALLHSREVTYSVTAPTAGERPRESYARINRLLLDGLRRMGVRALLASPSAPATRPGDAPCFLTPSSGELVVGDRKLVGSAQWRERGAFLQHGSILVDDDQHVLGELALRMFPASPPAATLRECLGRDATPGEVATALFASVRALEDSAAVPLADDALNDRTPLGDAARRLTKHFADDGWTWRT